MYEFVRSRVHSVQEKRYSLARRIQSHIQYTYNLCTSDLPELSGKQVADFERRLDVHLNPELGSSHGCPKLHGG